MDNLENEDLDFEEFHYGECLVCGLFEKRPGDPLCGRYLNGEFIPINCAEEYGEKDEPKKGSMDFCDDCPYYSECSKYGCPHQCANSLKDEDKAALHALEIKLIETYEGTVEKYGEDVDQWPSDDDDFGIEKFGSCVDCTNADICAEHGCPFDESDELFKYEHD